MISTSTPAPVTDVKIKSGFWSRFAKLVSEQVILYQYKVLNSKENHTIENLRIAAGLSKGEFHGLPFQDSDIAKWLEAASYSLAWRPNPTIEKAVDDVIEILAAAQQEDGYLNTYFTLEKSNQRWTDFSHGHELYCAGHLIEAAVAHHEVTGKKNSSGCCLPFRRLY